MQDQASQRFEPATVGRRLAAARVARSWSQRYVARRLRRPHSMVSRWEADVLEPSPWDLYRIARLLGTRPTQLLNDVVFAAPARRWSSRSHPRDRRTALGQTLRRRRAHRGVGLEHAVAMTGIRGGRILQIESGADPSLGELIRFAETLDFSIDEALRNAVLDNPPRPPNLRHQPLAAATSWTVVRTA
jgi:transcriptional regulator with XRE-family HTH domain